MSDIEPPILQLEDISKSFDRTPVLRDICLEVPRGSIVSLLGASGSGKTTLLQIIAGLQEPDSGSLRIGGRDMRSVPPFARPVNMMFQSYALFPHLSVLGNIEYGLRARGVERSERQRLAWALELTRLGELGGRRPDQLSGGQRQRVALARCLVMKPAILLLDEPMAALDRSLRAQVQRELVSIQRAVGTTFILVTHDQEEAMAISDYIAVMDMGRIAQFDRPRTLYERPQNRFVASFLGSINLFDGAAEDSGSGKLRFKTNEGVELLLERGGPVDWQRVRTVGFRPEQVLISRCPANLENTLPGVIEQITYAGTLTHTTIRIADGRRLDATLMNGRDSAATGLTRGDAVYAGLPSDAGVTLSE
jgi:putrescine transport system ATP-binding protein